MSAEPAAKAVRTRLGCSLTGGEIAMAGSFLVTVEAEVNSREVSEVVVVLVTVTSVLEEEWAVAMLEAAETFLLVMT